MYGIATAAAEDNYLLMLMKKVLITGGAGFIGAATSRLFRQRGFEVVTYDIVRPDEIVGTHIVGTIMYVDELFTAMKGCDFVVHLAAMLGVGRTEANKMECLNINVTGTKNVLDAAVYAGVKKVIFASSSEVYGDPEKNPITESDAVSPKSVYAVSKLAGEEYMKAYREQYGLAYSIVRFFNVFGPGQVAEFVIPRFVQSVLQDKPPLFYGDGSQERCFCYVDDAAEGIYLALTKDKANEKIFNIGNDLTTISMKALAEKVVLLAGKDLKPRSLPFERADRSKTREIRRRIASIARARAVLGFKPQTDLDTGIRALLQSRHIKTGWINYKGTSHE